MAANETSLSVDLTLLRNEHQFHTQHISQSHTISQSSPYSLATPLLPNPGSQEMSMTESHQQNNLQTNKHFITRPNYRPLPQFDQNSLHYNNGNADGLLRQTWSDEDSLQKEGRMSGSSHSLSGDIVTPRLDDKRRAASLVDDRTARTITMTTDIHISSC